MIHWPRMKTGSLLRPLLHSPALYTSALHAVMGIGFAGANLLLARALPTIDYALVILVLTLLNGGILLAPLGLDGVVNRRAVEPGLRLLCCTLCTSTLVGLGIVVAGRFIYGLDTILLMALFSGIVAGGATFVAAAKFQSAQRFTLAMLLDYSANLSLIIAAIVAIALGIQKAWLPLTIIVMGYFLTAAWSWSKLFGERPFQAGPVQTFACRDALYYAGVNATGFLLIQLERLLIPRLLTLEDLATFGVLAAIVIAPFRSLQVGVGLSLLPRLRAAATVAARRHILAKEGAIVAFVVLLGSSAIWYLTPLIVDWFLSGSYSISPALVLAALITGILKVMSALVRATVTAFCSTQELAYLNVLSGISVASAVAGAILGAHWGLTGVIYGVGLGWVCQGLASAYFALSYLREPSRFLVIPAEKSRF